MILGVPRTGFASGILGGVVQHSLLKGSGAILAAGWALRSLRDLLLELLARIWT